MSRGCSKARHCFCRASLYCSVWQDYQQGSVRHDCLRCIFVLWFWPNSWFISVFSSARQAILFMPTMKLRALWCLTGEACNTDANNYVNVVSLCSTRTTCKTSRNLHASRWQHTLTGFKYRHCVINWSSYHLVSLLPPCSTILSDIQQSWAWPYSSPCTSQSNQIEKADCFIGSCIMNIVPSSRNYIWLQVGSSESNISSKLPCNNLCCMFKNTMIGHLAKS